MEGIISYKKMRKDLLRKRFMLRPREFALRKVSKEH